MHKFPNLVSEEMISCFNNITILFYDTETQSSWCCLETGTGIGKIMINQNGNTKRNLLKKNIDSTDGLHTVGPHILKWTRSNFAMTISTSQQMISQFSVPMLARLPAN